jgi:hypothetical protein
VLDATEHGHTLSTGGLAQPRPPDGCAGSGRSTPSHSQRPLAISSSLTPRLPVTGSLRPASALPTEPLPRGHEPVGRATLHGEVLRCVRSAVRPCDPVMELHRVERTADVTVVPYEGAALFVAIGDLALHLNRRQWDLQASSPHHRHGRAQVVSSTIRSPPEAGIA